MLLLSAAAFLGSTARVERRVARLRLTQRTLPRTRLRLKPLLHFFAFFFALGFDGVTLPGPSSVALCGFDAGGYGVALPWQPSPEQPGLGGGGNGEKRPPIRAVYT